MQGNSLAKPFLMHSQDKMLILLDCESDEREVETIGMKISSANCIILVYSLNDLESIPKLSQFWLPLIQKHNPSIPVLLLGNKLDLVQGNKVRYDKTKVRRVMVLLFQVFKQLELGLECSVVKNISIDVILKSVQMLVFYPLGKLLDKNSRAITPRFKTAILRIFRLLDQDKDGWLSNENIMRMQEQVFHFDLTKL